MKITINEVINRADETRENQVERKTKIKWLSQLDEQIYQDIICKHENTENIPEFKEYTSDSDILLAPSRFEEMYVYYLFAKIDFDLMEMGRYANDSMAHSSEYNEYAKWYNRNNMPLQITKIHI